MIKTWDERLEAMDDGHITTNSDVSLAMQAEIDELRAELTALKNQNPVSHQYQSRDGTWSNFSCPKHLADTEADGTWPIRALYAAPVAQPVQERLALPADLVIKALRAMDAEARKRGEMYPQTLDEQREDTKAVRNVIASLEFYASKNQCSNGWPGVKDWPALPAPLTDAVIVLPREMDEDLYYIVGGAMGAQSPEQCGRADKLWSKLVARSDRMSKRTGGAT